VTDFRRNFDLVIVVVAGLLAYMLCRRFIRLRASVAPA
jgi:hypothetical protein